MEALNNLVSTHDYVRRSEIPNIALAVVDMDRMKSQKSVQNPCIVKSLYQVKNTESGAEICFKTFMA